MSYLMWEFDGVDVGRFHSAATKADRTAMIAKGYQDIDGLQSWAVKYPTGKSKIVPRKATTKSSKTAPAPTEPAPVDPIV